MSDAEGTFDFSDRQPLEVGRIEQLSDKPAPIDLDEVGVVVSPYNEKPVTDAPAVRYAKFLQVITELGDGRPTKDELFLAMAFLVSTRSSCTRRNVGCIITDENGEKIAMGYNGGPKGGRNTCARAEASACGCIHAEVNAVIKTTFDGPKTAYVTISPCELCALALVNAGVTRVVVGNVYRDEVGLDLMREVGVAVEVKDPEVITPLPSDPNHPVTPQGAP
jgi:dCMP deaminase